MLAQFADGLGVTALADIASGHKIALRDFRKGDNVLKYGSVIGATSGSSLVGSGGPT